MTILLNNDGYWHDKYRAALAKHLPERKVVEFDDDYDKADIEYALVWKHPDGDLPLYPNLKAVFSLGSGTDYLDAHKALPTAPIFRLIDPNMADDMALYTLYWIIHFQRQIEVLRQQQRKAIWQRYPTPLAHEVKVCVLGQGAIGGHIANVLSRNGFETFGWSRSPKSLDGVNSVVGLEALQTVLPDMDVVVCMLPAKPLTHKFLNKDIFERMKKGVSLINISRGSVVDEDDLLSALNQGQIGAAALDVFAIEPLPKSSPFWGHPNVHVTPHMSGATNADTAVEIIAQNIKLFEVGTMPNYRYEREGI